MKIDTSILSDPTKFECSRDGDIDLQLLGWRLGSGSNGSGGSGLSTDWNRGYDVDIYVSQGGNFVVATHYWSQWQGEESSYWAGVADSPEGLLELLRDQFGHLDRACKEALENAAKEFPPLSEHIVESVD